MSDIQVSVVKIPENMIRHHDFTWGPKEQKALTVVATMFKDEDKDLTGYYLCLAVKSEAAKIKESGDCAATVKLLLGLALAKADLTDPPWHALCHFLHAHLDHAMEQFKHEANLRDLMKDAGID